MKKTLKLLAVLAFVVLALMLSNKVSAVYVEDRNEGHNSIEYDGSNVTSRQQDDGTWLVELSSDTAQDFVIQNGDVVVLDLKGHQFTNYCDGTDDLPNCAAIVVEIGGKLTIKDSGENGTIKQKDDTKGVETIVNNGELVIEGGTITAITKTDNLAVVRNNAGATLMVSGGKVTGANECIQNLGTATISGGEINGTGDFYSVRNEGKLTISGGKITGTSNTTSVVGNIGNKNPELTMTNGNIEGNCNAFVNYNGELEISDGQVKGLYAVVAQGGKTTLSGGSFTATANDGKIIIVTEEGQQKNAEVVVEGGDYSEDVTEFIDLSNSATYEKDGKTYVGELKITGTESYKLKVNETADLNLKASVDEEDLTDRLLVSVSDDDIVKLENNKITGLKEGKTTLLVYLSDEDGETSDTVVKIIDVAVEVENRTPAEAEKDNTPDTGVVNVAVIASAIAMISALGIVTVKKYNK